MSESDTEIQEDDIEVLRDCEGDRRVELWTDGQWVKLGKDVREDLCLEFQIENFPKVESNIRYFDGGAQKSRYMTSAGYDVKYVVFGHHSQTVIKCREREVVLILGDDGWPLYNSRGAALEERDEQEPEEITRQYVRTFQKFRHVDEIETSRRGLTEKVLTKVVDEGAAKVKLRLLDSLRDAEPISDVSVMFDPDAASQVYKFEVNVDKVPPIDED